MFQYALSRNESQLQSELHLKSHYKITEEMGKEVMREMGYKTYIIE